MIVKISLICGMVKIKSSFFCTNCGAESAKWIGKCPACSEWNTYREEIIDKTSKSKPGKGRFSNKKEQPILIQDVAQQSVRKRAIPDKELHRVLGGGLVKGALILLGGEPGIGKSTLLLQLALQSNYKILYISGEESNAQIKLRADRIGIQNDSCYLVSETNIDHILAHAKKIEPDILIIDSIQTMSSQYLESTPGSISQVRECAGILQRFSKESQIPTFIIGHINKEGSIAGPKLLEHIVDTVLQFEGDRNHMYRLLRSLKNRFGSTDELGIYQMDGSGLAAVEQPSAFLLEQKESLSGSAIAAASEGVRALMIETQALVSTAIYGTPQRNTTGFDMKRVNMLLAVLEKRCGFFFGQLDVFINLAGGIKINDPALDLSLVAALISSIEDYSLQDRICFTGEIGLSGEVRPVHRIEQRIGEAERLGFDSIVIPKHNKKSVKSENYKINIIPVDRVTTFYREIFQQ